MEINRTTQQLEPVSFTIGSTFPDNVLEGEEDFSVRVSQTGILQVGENSIVNVRIRDATREFNVLKM